MVSALARDDSRPFPTLHNQRSALGAVASLGLRSSVFLHTFGRDRSDVDVASRSIKRTLGPGESLFLLYKCRELIAWTLGESCDRGSSSCTARAETQTRDGRHARERSRRLRHQLRSGA